MDLSQMLAAVKGLEEGMHKMPQHDKDALLNALKNIQKVHKAPAPQMVPVGKFNSSPNPRSPMQI